MPSINQEIAKLLNRHISIQKSLKRDIVNLRGLAKFLIKRYNLSYPVDGVISAIRRYEPVYFSVSTQESNDDTFDNMLITTKDHVARVVVKDNQFSKICEDYLFKCAILKKSNLRIIKSKEQITLIVSEKNLQDKLNFFDKDDIVDYQKDLSEIRLQFNTNITLLKGISSRITAELTTRNITIIEIIYSNNEILIYVKDKDLINAIDALRKIKN